MATSPSRVSLAGTPSRIPQPGVSLVGRGARLLVLLLAGLLLAACGDGNRGFPQQPGEYQLQPGSLSFDGKRYSMLWLDAGGAVHSAEGENVRLQRDTRTVLETGNGSPIVHLKEDEAVTVRGRDRDGEFNMPWFPFFLWGGGGGWSGPINQRYPGDSPIQGPAYQYPPSREFGRDDTMSGSIERSKPQPPDYSKVAPAPYAVSGQSGGTGGGNSATNKATAPSTSGQSGGTGAGSAASTKGTFSGGGSTGTGGTGIGGGSGLSGSKSSPGSDGAATNKTSPAPPRAAPSLPSRRR